MRRASWCLRNAVQVSQTGTFVFVVKDGVAQVQPVKVERQVGTESVIASGLNGGEIVVTEGQLLSVERHSRQHTHAEGRG